MGLHGIHSHVVISLLRAQHVGHDFAVLVVILFKEGQGLIVVPVVQSGESGFVSGTHLVEVVTQEAAHGTQYHDGCHDDPNDGLLAQALLLAGRFFFLGLLFLLGLLVGNGGDHGNFLSHWHGGSGNGNRRTALGAEGHAVFQGSTAGAAKSGGSFFRRDFFHRDLINGNFHNGDLLDGDFFNRHLRNGNFLRRDLFDRCFLHILFDILDGSVCFLHMLVGILDGSGFFLHILFDVLDRSGFFLHILSDVLSGSVCFLYILTGVLSRCVFLLGQYFFVDVLNRIHFLHRCAAVGAEAGAIHQRLAAVFTIHMHIPF